MPASAVEPIGVDLRGNRSVISRSPVNLILFDPDEITAPLSRQDPRARHIVEVLHRREGDTFDAGVVNGPRGKGTVETILPESLRLRFAWDDTPPRPPPLHLLIGLPRPQTARDILRDATSFGVTTLLFVQTEKGESSYGQSTLWTSGEWRRRLIAGAEQAFDTWIPDVKHGLPFDDALATLPDGSIRLALDNYEAACPLGGCTVDAETPVTLAVGAERGWSARERAALRAHHFTLAHLGSRILRTETAVSAALAIIRSKQGRM